MITRRFLLLIAALAIAVGLVSVARIIPLTTHEHTIVRPDVAKETLVLPANKTYTQSYEASPEGGYQSGIALYIDAASLDRQSVAIKITDSHNITQATADTYTSVSFMPDDALRVEFHVPWFYTNPNEMLTLHISSLGTPIPLRVYKEKPALTLLYPSTLPDGAKRGFIVAAAFVLGMYLVSLLPKKHRWLATATLLCFITPLALLGFWYSIGELGISDWDLYFSYHHYVKRTVQEFNQFPHWNPWLCGGTAGLADPEFPLFTPTFVFEYFFGIPTGLRLAIFFSVATTAVGMLALARKIGLSLFAATIAALAGTFGSVTLLEIVEGHPNVFNAMWIPWIFWAWLHAYHRKSYWSIVTGIFLALAFYGGGIYLLMYTGLAFLLIIALASRHLRAFLITLQSGLWALGFAALKLIPVLLWLRQFPDESYASSTFTLSYFTNILLGRHIHGDAILLNQGSGWHEYGAYIGYIVFTLAIIGLVGMRRRLVASLAIAALAALLLSSSGPALEPIFDHLPFFPRSNISRFILFTVIPMALLAGFGSDILIRRTRSTIVALLLIGIVAADLMSLSYLLSEQAFVLRNPVPLPHSAPAPLAFTAERFDESGSGNRTTRTYAAAKVGYGTLAYCSVLGPPPMVRTIHDEVDNGPISFTPGGPEDHAEIKSWTPNEVRVSTYVLEPARLTLNTNYAPAWEVIASNDTTKSASARSDNGRVSTEVAPGTKEVTFRYTTPGFIAGSIITSLSILLATAYLAKRQRRVKLKT